MKHLMIRLGIALAGGVGLTLAVVGPLSSSRSAEHSVAHSTEWQVCPSGCHYASIQDAIDAASDGDVIKVAAGTYTGVNVHPRNDITSTGVVTQLVYISKTITIQGGYTTINWTTSDPTANPTMLDAEGQGRVLYITGDISPIVEGLRLTGGNAAGLGGHQNPGGAGGGVYVISAAARIRNNWVFSNSASFGGGLYLYGSAATLNGNTVTSNSGGMGGGGLYLYGSTAALNGNTVISNAALLGGGGGLFLDSSAATLNGNIIVSNTTIGGRGGGLHLLHSPATLSGNTVSANYARRGGGLYLYYSPATLSGNTVSANRDYYFGGGGGLLLIMSGATLSGNTVVSNTSNDNGGGLHLDSSDAILNGNVIISNTSIYGDGGGVFLGSSAATLNRNIVVANTAITGSGGGLYLAGEGNALVNNVVADNQANGLGSGLYIRGSAPRLLHTTIARNRGGDGSGVYIDFGATPVMTNTILVSQTVGLTVTEGGTATLMGTLWGSGAWANGINWGGAGAINTGTFNIVGDPGFVDPDAGDYHLGPNSAALDVGVNAGVMTDIDNQPRPYQAPDLGADEYWPPGALKYVYLPFVARTPPACPGNVLINGSFEQGHTGWYTYTTGSGWKQHDLIGSDTEGFDPYSGHYAAKLGGYEGVWDVITQTVVIPVHGELTYWWKGKTYETLPHHDTFDVALLDRDGALVASLAHHDDQDVPDTWRPDVLDVSAYAGQTLTLRFSSYNDNYYFTVFHLDTICLSSAGSR